MSTFDSKDPEFSVIVQKFVEQGNRPFVVKRVLYPNKPKCWVEGNEYKFNSYLLSIQPEEDYINEARSSTHS